MRKKRERTIKMVGRSKPVRLFERDFNFMRDIYEFYYHDFYAARNLYYYASSNIHSARNMFNQRANKLVEQDLLAKVPYFSERRKSDRGGANYAYTLTTKGLNTLADRLGVELNWDVKRKERKSLYIQHHLNILYYVSLYRPSIESGKIEEYYGEQSSRFQMPNSEGHLKDFIKPDASIMWKENDRIVPWFIEYERDSRASRSTINKKLKQYDDYGRRGLYTQHSILQEHDHVLRPILLLYCQEEKVAKRRLNEIYKNQMQFYDYEREFGFGDLIIAIQNEVEENPYGTVYRRYNGERVSIPHINHVQMLSESFTSNRIEAFPDNLKYKWIPSYASYVGQSLDGMVSITGGQNSSTAAYLIKYFDDSVPFDQAYREISSLVDNDKLTKHRILSKAYQSGNKPVLLLIAGSVDQEDQLLKIQSSLQNREYIQHVFVSRSDLIADNPYLDNWRHVDFQERRHPYL